MTTLAGKIAAAKGRPAGFDYMRLGLATAVIVSHAWYAESTALVGAEWQLPMRPVWGRVLPMFFALSGFLVAGSFERSRSLSTFLGLRGIRLLPALMVETTLSALILGPLFTTASLGAYFGSTDFLRYFGNIVGFIHFTLPGVFKSNPSTAVNSQLWTLPAELACYVVLAILAAIGAASRRMLLLVALIGVQLVMAAHLVHHGPAEIGLMKPRVLVFAFFTGVLLHSFRDRVPHHGALLAAALIVTMVLLALPSGEDFIALPAAYLTTFLGTLNPARNRLLLSGDYSYGLYLSGFSIQQAVTATGFLVPPLVDQPADRHAARCRFRGSFVWCIERPALGLKALLVHVGKGALRFPPLRWRRNVDRSPPLAPADKQT